MTAQDRYAFEDLIWFGATNLPFVLLIMLFHLVAFNHWSPQNFFSGKISDISPKQHHFDTFFPVFSPFHPWNVWLIFFTMSDGGMELHAATVGLPHSRYPFYCVERRKFSTIEHGTMSASTRTCRPNTQSPRGTKVITDLWLHSPGPESV